MTIDPFRHLYVYTDAIYSCIILLQLPLFTNLNVHWIPTTSSSLNTDVRRESEVLLTLTFTLSGPRLCAITESSQTRCSRFTISTSFFRAMFRDNRYEVQYALVKVAAFSSQPGLVGSPQPAPLPSFFSSILSTSNGDCQICQKKKMIPHPQRLIILIKAERNTSPRRSVEPWMQNAPTAMLKLMTDHVRATIGMLRKQAITVKSTSSPRWET